MINLTKQAAIAAFDNKTIARFWSKVDKNGPLWKDGTHCWVWTAGKFTSGYGAFWAEGKLYRAHLVSFGLTNPGPLPEGLVPDHLCRRRDCVRPWHIEFVTSQVNVLRGETLPAANAAKTACPRGHSYVGKIWSKRAIRVCPICKSERTRILYADAVSTPEKRAAYNARKLRELRRRSTS